MPLSELEQALTTDWTDALRDRGALSRLQELVSRVGAERADGLAIAPSDRDLLRALNTTSMLDIRVVILGQDPYPTPGHADGLCFSVRPGVAIPRSLGNIFTELESDLGLPRPKSGSLVPWAEQGVLLLNTVLSVTEGQPASHAAWGWQDVTDAMISAISDRANPTVFILWGRHAQAKKRLIDRSRHLVIESPHPSPLSARRGFFGSRPFSRANSWLIERGRKPVDWRLPAT